MKKPLLIGVATVALIGVSATLFAQTATVSSVIAEMKAAARSFTLKADLNSGSTANLQSSPVTGKETGDMLTAGEWNRVLELVAQGGGVSSWVNVPLTDTADYDVSCQYRLTMSFADDVNRKWHNATSATYYISMMSSKYLGLGIYNADQNYFGIPSTTKSQYGYRSPAGVFTQSSNVTVTKLEKKC